MCQWWIQDFPQVGGNNSPVGCQHMIFAKFPQKLYFEVPFKMGFTVVSTITPVNGGNVCMTTGCHDVTAHDILCLFFR